MQTDDSKRAAHRRILVVTAVLMLLVVATVWLWPDAVESDKESSTAERSEQLVAQQATATAEVAAWANGEPVYRQELDREVLLALGAGTGYTMVLESGAFVTTTTACEQVLEQLVADELAYQAGTGTGYTASITEVAEWVEQRRGQKEEFPMWAAVEQVEMHVIGTTSETEYEAYLEERAGTAIVRKKWSKAMSESAEPVGEETVDAAVATAQTALPDYARSATNTDEDYVGMLHRSDQSASLDSVRRNRQIDPTVLRSSERERLAHEAARGAWLDALDDLRAGATITYEVDCATYVPPPWPY